MFELARTNRVNNYCGKCHSEYFEHATCNCNHMPTIQEQLEKIEKKFELDKVAHSQGRCSFSSIALCSAVEQEVKRFLRTSAIELVKSVVEGIKGQEDLERLKEILKEL